MSHIIRDSFDFYATSADMASNYWASNTISALSSTQTPFGTGQSLSGIAGQQATFNSPRNHATQFFTGRLRSAQNFSGGTSTAYVTFMDGATSQVTIAFRNNGNIDILRGGNTGTVVATYASGYSQQTWTHFQVKVVIDGAAGEVHIRKDGNTSDDFSATGLNIQSSANAYANGGVIGLPTFSIGMFFDDIWIFDGDTGATPNDWIGDCRAVQVMPNADSSVQFTRNPTNPQQTLNATGTTRSANANTITTLNSFAALVDGTLDSIQIQLNAGVTGNVNIALYDNTGLAGAPGALLATATAITNPTSGAQTFTFPSPPTVVRGQTYWAAALTDVSTSLKGSGVGSIQQYSQSRTYASGFSNPMSPTSFTGVGLYQLNSYTPSGNFTMVSDLIEDGTTTILQDGNVGDKDLFTSAGLSTTPSAILGVSLRVFGCKSDAGTRSGQPTMTSGVTVQDGASTPLSVTMENLVMVQDVDPATGLAWTASGVNNLKFGMKVSA